MLITLAKGSEAIWGKQDLGARPPAAGREGNLPRKYRYTGEVSDEGPQDPEGRLRQNGTDGDRAGVWVMGACAKSRLPPWPHLTIHYLKSVFYE